MFKDSMDRKERAKALEIQAKKVCFSIALFGMLMLYAFNINFSLAFSGNKYIANVVELRKTDRGKNGGFTIQVEYERLDGEQVQETIVDYTGEYFLFWIEKGDNLTIYESKSKPYKRYVPYISFMPKVLIYIFFVFVPLLFAFFGKSNYN